MLTVEDDHIRQLDVPERLQLASAGLGQQGLNELGHLAPYIAPDEIDTAAHWMSKRISTERTEQFCVQNTATGDLPELHAEFIEAIKSALTFLNIDFLEVPFIWHHRSDYLVKYGDADKQEDTVAFLAQPDLFRLEDLSIKYRAFLSRKKELRSLIESLGLTGESTDEFLEDYFDNLDSVEDIADLNDWVSMRYVDRIQAAKRDKLRDDLVRRELADGANEEEEQAAIARAEQQLQARKKRATRESAYEVAKKSMISRLAEVILRLRCGDRSEPDDGVISAGLWTSCARAVSGDDVGQQDDGARRSGCDAARARRRLRWHHRIPERDICDER